MISVLIKNKLPFPLKLNVLHFQVIFVLWSQKNVVWFNVHVNNTKSVNVDQSIKNLEREMIHKILGLGIIISQLKMCWDQGYIVRR